MSSTDDDRDGRAAVRDAVLDEETFIRLTATGRVRGERPPWVKVVVRPVLVRGRRRSRMLRPSSAGAGSATARTEVRTGAPYERQSREGRWRRDG